MKRQRQKRRLRQKYQKTTTTKKKMQRGIFLNRYDFAYAGRDTVSQLGKVAPGIIKNATSEINNIA